MTTIIKPDVNITIQADCFNVMQGMEVGSVDLICTDPPFFTQKQWSGEAGSFDDRFESINGFISFMGERAAEMHRLLKPTGSLYWHCDPTASHYLKVMLDEIFGRRNFRAEIVWEFVNATGFKSAAHNWIHDHDVILYYRKSDKAAFHKQYKPYRQASIDAFNKRDDAGRSYYNRHNKRYYLDERKGSPITNVWSDITPIVRGNTEGEGYPTQKPVALYERMILASSNPNDMVFDPFCGSGTTLVAAARHGRKWIGIDESADAVSLTKERIERETAQDRLVI